MRIATLDSVRGIAALMVVLSHGLAAYDVNLLVSPPWFLRWIAFGRPEVIIFFVLSGFVLSLPYLSDKEFSYSAYVIRRLCRLYIPFAAAIFFSAGLYLIVRPAHIVGATWWVNALWNAAPAPGLLAAHLAMIGTSSDVTLDPVMWSLVHELRISAIFPVLVFFARRQTILSLIISIAVAFACAAFSGIKPQIISGEDVAASVIASAYFVPFFVGGIALAKHKDQIVVCMARLPGYVLALIPIVSLAAFSWPTTSIWADLFFGPAACALIAMALAAPGAAIVLNSAICLWLGRVSYSLYLFHLPIFLALIHALAGRLPLVAILALALALSLCAAEIAYRLIEYPAIRLGRWLTYRPDLRLIAAE